jgi:hypothetical protein
MDKIVEVLNALAPIVGILVGTGLFVKYVPFMKNVSNQLIPLLNAVIAFLTVFVPAADASIFGQIGKTLSGAGSALGSVALAAMAHHVYEFVLRIPLNKLGLKKAV